MPAEMSPLMLSEGSDEHQSEEPFKFLSLPLELQIMVIDQAMRLESTDQSAPSKRAIITAFAPEAQMYAPAKQETMTGLQNTAFKSYWKHFNKLVTRENEVELGRLRMVELLKIKHLTIMGMGNLATPEFQAQKILLRNNFESITVDISRVCFPHRCIIRDRYSGPCGCVSSACVTLWLINASSGCLRLFWRLRTRGVIGASELEEERRLHRLGLLEGSELSEHMSLSKDHLGVSNPSYNTHEDCLEVNMKLRIPGIVGRIVERTPASVLWCFSMEDGKALQVIPWCEQVLED